MAPTVLLIRHAQAQHNATDKCRSWHAQSLADRVSQDWNLPDPALTELGLQQCRELAVHLQTVDIARQIELIITSPMCRTLQTTRASLGWLIDQGVPVECWGEFQENSTKPCDTGSPVDQFKSDFLPFDFSTVYAKWPEKSGQYAFSQEAVEARGKACRERLNERPEKVIAVVSHSAFLRLGVTQNWFANADYRVYDFTEKGELVQWKETEQRGGGMGKSFKGTVVPRPSDFEL